MTSSTPEPISRHQRLFEDCNGLLQLKLNYVHLLSPAAPVVGENCIPENRLYLVIHAPANAKSHIIDCPGGEEQRLALCSGGVYFMPAHIQLRFRFMPGIYMIGLHFRLELFSGFDVFTESVRCQEQLGHDTMVNEIERDLRYGESTGQMVRAKALILYLAGRFLDVSVGELQHTVQKHERYRGLFDHMRRRPIAALTVGELAAVQGQSRDVLSRRFRQDIGLPLKRFLIRETMQQASAELLFGERRVKEIAWLLGFSNEFYFSRFFKKHAGVSPQDYRRSTHFALDGE